MISWLKSFFDGIASFSNELINADHTISLKEICDNISNFSILLGILTIQVWSIKRVAGYFSDKHLIGHSEARLFGTAEGILFAGTALTMFLIAVNLHHTAKICQKIKVRYLQHIGKSDVHQRFIGYVIGGYAIAVLLAIVIGFVELYGHLV
jgi:hypothetical protein